MVSIKQTYCNRRIILLGFLIASINAFSPPSYFTPTRTSGVITSSSCLFWARNSGSTMEEPLLVVSLRKHLQCQSDGAVSDDKIRFILASQSPRRKEILDMMGLHGRFEAIPSPMDESVLQETLSKSNPHDYTRILAKEKALALAKSLKHSSVTTLILGSDTIVAFAKRILEKPIDGEDAKRMLQQLQGNRHEVHTAVSLMRVDSTGIVDVATFVETANVTFAELSEADISAYVATGEPMDKAGSYGIQGIGGQLVTTIEGDFFTVMGLPMHKTSRALALAISSILNCS